MGELLAFNIAEQWPIIVLLVLAVILLVPTYLKQKKQNNEAIELMNSIKKGTRVITHFGVYGVVEKIEDTTDGKVVVLNTGDSKNPSTMTVHIRAIMGIDNKTNVEEAVEETVEEKKAENIVEQQDTVVTEDNKKDLEEFSPVKSKKKSK